MSLRAVQRVTFTPCYVIVPPFQGAELLLPDDNRASSCPTPRASPLNGRGGTMQLNGF